MVWQLENLQFKRIIHDLYDDLYGPKKWSVLLYVDTNTYKSVEIRNEALYINHS